MKRPVSQAVKTGRLGKKTAGKFSRAAFQQQHWGVMKISSLALVGSKTSLLAPHS